jgi:hypothetical protein
MKQLIRLSTLILLVGALALAGCGSTSSSSTPAGSGANGTSSTTPHIAFAKTKFLIHAGLAFGAFHRYIWKPFRKGGFTPPLQHKAAIVKAGVAALFAYHEAKIALMDAQASPTLSKLVSPLTALQKRLGSLGTALKQGKLDASGITAANSTVNSVASESASSYKQIKDAPTPALG